MRIRIDAAEMVMALDDHGGLAEWFLDRTSGELLRICDAAFGEEGDELRARIEAEPEQYLLIEPLASFFGYRLMSGFTGDVTDAAARADLDRALAGRKPFRAFKDALLAYPDLREHWFRFRDERYLKEARAWLEAEGIEAELLIRAPRGG